MRKIITIRAIFTSSCKITQIVVVHADCAGSGCAFLAVGSRTGLAGLIGGFVVVTI